MQDIEQEDAIAFGIFPFEQVLQFEPDAGHFDRALACDTDFVFVVIDAEEGASVAAIGKPMGSDAVAAAEVEDEAEWNDGVEAVGDECRVSSVVGRPRSPHSGNERRGSWIVGSGTPHPGPLPVGRGEGEAARTFCALIGLTDWFASGGLADIAFPLPPAPSPSGWVGGLADIAFPLTPALSLGERVRALGDHGIERVEFHFPMDELLDEFALVAIEALDFAAENFRRIDFVELLLEGISDDGFAMAH